MPGFSLRNPTPHLLSLSLVAIFPRRSLTQTLGFRSLYSKVSHTEPRRIFTGHTTLLLPRNSERLPYFKDFYPKC